MKRYALLVMACLITACHRPPLTCRSEYLYPDYLASQQVDTPDEKREAFVGQQVVTFWNVPNHYLEQPITLVLHLRYGNREMEKLVREIDRPKGWWIYRLLNENYFEKCGILSFQAKLIQDGQILSQWNHTLWAEIIQYPCSEQ